VAVLDGDRHLSPNHGGNVSLKTKMAGVGVAITVVAAAFTASAIGIIPIKPAPKVTGDERNITFSGLWTPSPRPEGVQIGIFIDGQPMLGEEGITKVTAPFSRVYPAAVGQRVEIRLKLAGKSSGYLGCGLFSDRTGEMDIDGTTVSAGYLMTCWAIVA